jgi:hypothetical protein
MANATIGMKKQSPTRCIFTVDGTIMFALLLSETLFSTAFIDNGMADALDAVLNAVVTAGTMFPMRDENFGKLKPEVVKNCSDIQEQAEIANTKRIGKYCSNIWMSTPSLCSLIAVPTIKIGMIGIRILKYAPVNFSITREAANARLFAIKKRISPPIAPKPRATSFDTSLGKEIEKYGSRMSTAPDRTWPIPLQNPDVCSEMTYAITVLMKFEQQTSDAINNTYFIALLPSLTTDVNTSANIMNGSEKMRHSLMDTLIA